MLNYKIDILFSDDTVIKDTEGYEVVFNQDINIHQSKYVQKLLNHFRIILKFKVFIIGLYYKHIYDYKVWIKEKSIEMNNYIADCEYGILDDQTGVFLEVMVVPETIIRKYFI